MNADYIAQAAEQALNEKDAEIAQLQRSKELAAAQARHLAQKAEEESRLKKLSEQQVQHLIGSVQLGETHAEHLQRQKDLAVSQSHHLADKGKELTEENDKMRQTVQEMQAQLRDRDSRIQTLQGQVADARRNAASEAAVVAERQRAAEERQRATDGELAEAKKSFALKVAEL